MKLSVAALIFSLIFAALLPGLAAAEGLANPAPVPTAAAPGTQIVPARTETSDTNGRLIGRSSKVENQVFTVRTDGKDRAEIRLTVQEWYEPIGRPLFIKVEVKCAGKDQAFKTWDTLRAYAFEGLHFDKTTSKLSLAYRMARMSNGEVRPTPVIVPRTRELGCP